MQCKAFKWDIHGNKLEADDLKLASLRSSLKPKIMNLETSARTKFIKTKTQRPTLMRKVKGSRNHF